MNRRNAREKAVQALFQISFGHTEAADALEYVSAGEQDAFLTALVEETLAHIEEIDELIKKYLIKWSFERIGKIDKTILRMAICEMFYFDDIPVNVSLNEATEMAKLYGDDETRKFVNGLLSRLADKEIKNKGE